MMTKTELIEFLEVNPDIEGAFYYTDWEYEIYGTDHDLLASLDPTLEVLGPTLEVIDEVRLPFSVYTFSCEDGSISLKFTGSGFEVVTPEEKTVTVWS